MINNKGKRLLLSQNFKIEYPIHFSENIFNLDGYSKSELYKVCKNKEALIVIDKNVNKIYGKTVKDYFSKLGNNFYFKEIAAIESNKNINLINELCNYAKELGLKRNSLFIAIGGGIILDLVGFSAFIYRRKIPYIRIPTTLLGMVDAGIGIKVGVNFNGAKNFLGGFHAPTIVLNDQSFLKTLDLKEIRCGLYEILKMAIIKDKSLFLSLEKKVKNFISKNFDKNTSKIIYDSAFLMMDELHINLYESDLKRAVDFGHTFSPFLETFSTYVIPHGQAVGIDILISSFISFKRRILSKTGFMRIVDLVKEIGFSQKYTLPNSSLLLSSLEEIRRHRAENLNLVLPTRIGSCTFTNKCSLLELENAFEFILSTVLSKAQFTP